MISDLCTRRLLAGLKVRCAVLATALVAAAAGALGAASPTGAAPMYPDLRMTSPTELHFETEVVDGQTHHFLHLSTRQSNVGEGAFEIDRTPTGGATANLSQRIYDDSGGFRDEPLGSTIFDASFFPIADIATYQLWTERAFTRAEARGFTRGQPLYSRANVDFCVRNAEPIDEDAVNALGVFGVSSPPYAGCNALFTGISAGWRNYEDSWEEYQRIDLGTSPLPDGDYVLRAIVDPDNLFLESAGNVSARESKVANSAVTYFRLAGGQLAGIGPLF